MSKAHRSHGCCSPHPELQLLIDDSEELPEPGPVEEREEEGTHATHAYFGRIVTMDSSRPEAEAMAVRHKRIICVGTREEVEAHCGRLTKKTELGTNVMYPGFVEPHMHIWSTAINYKWLDCSRFANQTVDEVLAGIREAAKAARPGEWVTGKLFDPALFPGLPELTIKELDPIAPDNPVFIFNTSQHFGYVNSRALELVGYTDSTPDPAGGFLQRDAQGHLTGVLGEIQAMAPCLAKMSKLKIAGSLLENIESITRDAARVGVTSMREALTGSVMGDKEILLLRVMKGMGKLHTRLSLAISDIKAEVWERSPHIKPGYGDDLLEVRAWKMVGDGSNQGRSGYLKEPYLNTDVRGCMDLTVEDLERRMAWCEENGWQLMVHANGDAAIEMVADSYYKVLKEVERKGLRHRIEHCSLVPDDELFSRMAEVGVSPSFLINHVYYWGRAFIDTILGEERSQYLDRLASAKVSGLRFTMHSDYNVSPINPLHYVKVAATRTMWDGGEVLNPSQCIPVYDALKAMTIDSAWQIWMDDRVGSLQPGKYADMVILDQDPQRIEPEQIDDIQVLETWMNGKRTYAKS